MVGGQSGYTQVALGPGMCIALEVFHDGSGKGPLPGQNGF